MHFSLKEALDIAWSKFISNAGLLIALSGAYFFIISVLGYLVNNIDKAEHPIVSGCAHFAVTLFSLGLLIGMIKIILALIDNREAHFGELFKNWAPWLSFAVAYVLVLAAITAGLLLLIIPGIIWAIQFSFYAYFIVDHGLAPIDALKASSQLTKGIKRELLGFYVVLLLINLAGILAFGFGFLITYPITFLAHAYVYRRLSSTKLNKV